MALGIYDYFARACRRETGVSGVAGAVIADADGNKAAFWIQLRGGIVWRVQYKCTTCVTLVALCEHLSEMAEGQEPAEAFGFGANRLLAAHPEVPAERRGRAALAVSALHSALENLTEEKLIEGSIHLLDARAYSLL